VNPNLKYGGEALFLAVLAFRLLRWAWGAVSEGDAPPSADAANPLAIGAALMGDGDAPVGATHGVAPTGDPAVFPPEMLAAMTPSSVPMYWRRSPSSVLPRREPPMCRHQSSSLEGLIKGYGQ
jgi:hypothetical protein